MSNFNNPELFKKFLNGGFFSLPILLKFSCPGLKDILLCNNNTDITFNDEVYKASSFKYTPPDSVGKGASLQISANENNLIPFIENADENYRLDVTGLIAENGIIEKIRQYSHFYGSATISDNGEVNFELGSDDRMEMTFPPYKFDTEINQGNA